MVRLTRIYTGGGDKGETSLGDGSRVAKHDPRVAAYGTVDEANAVIGIARAELGREMAGLDAGAAKERLERYDVMLSRIQNDLFDAGADLCNPLTQQRRPDALRVSAEQAKRLEQEIDAINGDLQPLTSFVLPGGTPAAAFLHQARTVVRRAEREVTEIAASEPVNPEVVVYLNRLSDLLFVLARHANDRGAADVLWVPGANR
ncbi:MAG: cob(I)yrinic acid a,c-diamide adenosyltransferase [Alphaproteobacteria bacterium]|nr:cob(I)yrinic acid a,c-diamide adenosyltransferase [Alphaproteobacteria bacterium]